MRSNYYGDLFFEFVEYWKNIWLFMLFLFQSSDLSSFLYLEHVEKNLSFVLMWHNTYPHHINFSDVC